MEALEAIFTRRSIRKYDGSQVDPGAVRTLLKAGMSAPSAGNQQPWHFIVVTDRELLNGIQRVHPYAQMLLTAPAAIVVCAELSLQKHPGSWVQDCSAATQNILLAARAMGLGTCWLGVHPKAEREEPIRKLFGLPEGIEPFAIVALGHPAEEKETPDRYNAGRVHDNRW